MEKTEGKENIMKKVISTTKAPGAVGPYSQGWRAGNLVFVSGQLPIDPETSGMPDTIREQAELSCKNVLAVLAAENIPAEDVVKTTCFLADMEDFAVFNEIYSKYFTGHPARSCVAVKELPKGALCEIEAIALGKKIK